MKTGRHWDYEKNMPDETLIEPAKVVDRLREVAASLDGVYGRDQTERDHLQ